MLVFLVDVVFGFDRDVTTVPEFAGEVDICVVISSPSPDEYLRAALFVNIQATYTSAGMSSQTS